MRAEPEALKRCDKHGLNFDPRLTRGCVLCRRSSDDPGASQTNTRYIIGAVALIGALAVFGWIYVKPLIVSDGEARRSYVGLSPDATDVHRKPAREPEAGAAGTTAAAAPANAAPVEAATALHPIDSAMWTEVARAFEPFEDDPIVQELRGGYGIHVYVPRTAQLNLEQGKLIGTRPSQEEITAAARALIERLGRYTRPFVQRMGLQQVVLVAGLRHKGDAVGAFAMGPAGALFATPEALADEGALHHELFHFVDYRLHGVPANHSAWIALNPAGTRYRGSARALLKQNRPGAAKTTTLRRDLPGFVTEYAQADAAEDMAEVFQLLMTQRPELYQLASADPVIAAKVTHVIQALDRIAPSTSAALNL